MPFRSLVVKEGADGEDTCCGSALGLGKRAASREVLRGREEQVGFRLVSGIHR